MLFKVDMIKCFWHNFTSREGEIDQEFDEGSWWQRRRRWGWRTWECNVPHDVDPRVPDVQTANGASEAVARERHANAEVALDQAERLVNRARSRRQIRGYEIEVNEQLTLGAVEGNCDVVPLTVRQAPSVGKAARRDVQRAEGVADASEAVVQYQAVLEAGLHISPADDGGKWIGDWER